MKIGVDLSSLQGPHRMRGIGYTLLNLMNHLSSADKKRLSFVFYYYEPDAETIDPLELLKLDGVTYEVRFMRQATRVKKRLRGQLGMLTGLCNMVLDLKERHFGDSRITNLSEIEYFLQTDQSQPLPRHKRGLKTGLIIYDIIPYVLSWDYLWSYSDARNQGYPRRAAWRKQAHRWLYGHRLRLNAKRADELLSISEHTKNDFVEFLGIKENKITVVPLGVTEPTTSIDTPQLFRYEKTSWGYMPRPYTLEDTPFIMFVGGADSRRKLNDLVSAFNILRANGHNIQLVLAGDSMQGPDHIATTVIRQALKESSYLEDIIFLGFTDDWTRDWLYTKTLAFVFPSRYEGFGLPVLEAMIHGSPVICYPNAATQEVAGKVSLYASDVEQLAARVEDLLSMNETERQKLKDQGLAHARKYSWERTTAKIFSIITN